MPKPLKVKGVHHAALPCRDGEETRRFYEDLLGLPLAHVVRGDDLPGGGQGTGPYCHLFFRMGDGSYLAFFDLGTGRGAEPSPNAPFWVNHLALEMASLDELQAAKQRLIEAGIAVRGAIDHEFVQSIYFLDPSGHLVELTAKTAPPGYLERCAAEARAKLDAWTRERRGQSSS